MDQNTTLTELVALAEAQLNACVGDMDGSELSSAAGDAVRLGELVVALNKWIQSGGELPDNWKAVRRSGYEKCDRLVLNDYIPKLSDMVAAEDIKSEYDLRFTEDEYHQLIVWLKELKQYRDARKSANDFAKMRVASKIFGSGGGLPEAACDKAEKLIAECARRGWLKS